MTGRPPQSGLRAEEAVERLLRLIRKDPVKRRIGWDHDESPESVLVLLDAQNVASTAARVRSADLRFVSTPALLQTENHSWLVLHRVRGSRLVLEGAGGVEEVPIAALPSGLARYAIQVLPDFPSEGNHWRRLIALLRRERGALVQMGIASLALMILALLPPQLTRLVVDRVLRATPRATSLLDILVIGVVLVTAFQLWAMWLRSKIVLYVKARTEMSLHGGFLAHLLRLPFAFLDRRTPGELMQSASALSAAQSLLLDRCATAVLDAAVSLAVFVVMVVMMPGPSIAVVAAAASIAFLSIVVSRRQAVLQNVETAAQVKQRDYLFELLYGAATVKAAGYENRGVREWSSRLREGMTISLRRQQTGLWFEVGAEVLRLAFMATVLAWGAQRVLAGSETTGTLLSFLQMAIVFVTGVANVGATYSAYVMLRPQLVFADEALAVQRVARRSGSPSNGRYAVVFDRVWFRYEGDTEWILRDLSLVVPRGETCWVQGPSGAGKSTILRLAAGLYTPQRGNVTVLGGEPDAASDRILYLPQLVRLYGGSIMENLRILSAHASRSHLLAAARASGLHEIVARMPMGYETALPPGGGALSGGERQLLAITAAMAADRDLLLLDESLSHLDNISRARIRECQYFAAKTVVYVSHEGGWAGAIHTFVIP